MKCGILIVILLKPSIVVIGVEGVMDIDAASIQHFSSVIMSLSHREHLVGISEEEVVTPTNGKGNSS